MFPWDMISMNDWMNFILINQVHLVRDVNSYIQHIKVCPCAEKAAISWIFKLELHIIENVFGKVLK